MMKLFHNAVLELNSIKAWDSISNRYVSLT